MEDTTSVTSVRGLEVVGERQLAPLVRQGSHEPPYEPRFPSRLGEASRFRPFSCHEIFRTVTAGLASRKALAYLEVGELEFPQWAEKQTPPMHLSTLMTTWKSRRPKCGGAQRSFLCDMVGCVSRP
jgi:hypothetical protein